LAGETVSAFNDFTRSCLKLVIGLIINNAFITYVAFTDYCLYCRAVLQQLTRYRANPRLTPFKVSFTHGLAVCAYTKLNVCVITMYSKIRGLYFCIW
jgi:hypothetical protein